MFELKPDFEQVLNRFEAWWECEIIDRPLASITFPKAVGQNGILSYKERWLDVEYNVRLWEANIRNTVYFADALPVAWPNLGPEVFSAFYGCPLDFGETTSWSKPILKDWSPESVNKLQLDPNNFYFKKIMELTDALLEVGRGKFIVGYTDLHVGGDAIAAFRDPQQLCIDILEYPEQIKSLCERITNDFLKAYNIFHEKLSTAGMPSTTWLPATCKGRFHVPSNDFSCMISNKQFEEIFIPGIIRECQHMDRCIYHLDGPGALRYLDLILDVPEIDAIQWVPTTGQDYWANWIDVYQRIQQRGKALQIQSIPVSDLKILFEVLRPKGVWLSSITGINNEEEANSALKLIGRWGCH